MSTLDPCTLTEPLVIEAAGACGALGLNSRALAAALWSKANRFALIDGDDFAIDDVLRVAMCPLFDCTIPTQMRVVVMLQHALSALPQQLLKRVHAVHLMVDQSLRAHVQKNGILPSAKERLTQQGNRGLVAALQSLVQDASWTSHAAYKSTANGAPKSLLAACDSMFSSAILQPLHRAAALSTEQLAQGIIPSEAAAVMIVGPLTDSAQAPQGAPQQRPIVRGACWTPIDQKPSLALIAAIQAAIGTKDSAPNTISTVIWDVQAHASNLTDMAEVVSAMSQDLADAQFVRPLQYMGCTGLAFLPLAMILALEGCRAGVTQGKRTLICSLTSEGAAAIVVEAPTRPNIMFQDADHGRAP